jgi:sulfur carrier protein
VAEITIVLNGESRVFLLAQPTISELFNTLSLSSNNRIVELNGDILSPDQYKFRVISDGDRVEIIQFVGGGG